MVSILLVRLDSEIADFITRVFMNPVTVIKQDRFEVLLVENCEVDVQAFKEAVVASSLPLHVTVAEDGLEALMRLNGLGRYSGSERPKLILMDWNLPKLTGSEVLSEIRRNLFLRSIPVIILAGSPSKEDQQDAQRLEANLFLTKPVDSAGYRGLIQKFGLFA